MIMLTCSINLWLQYTPPASIRSEVRISSCWGRTHDEWIEWKWKEFRNVLKKRQIFCCSTRCYFYASCCRHVESMPLSMTIQQQVATMNILDQSGSNAKFYAFDIYWMQLYEFSKFLKILTIFRNACPISGKSSQFQIILPNFGKFHIISGKLS